MAGVDDFEGFFLGIRETGIVCTCTFEINVQTWNTGRSSPLS